MAARSLGTLTLDLVAKVGGFTEGLDKASRESDKRSREIEKYLDRINIKAVAVGTAIGQLLGEGIAKAVNAFPSLVNALDQFNDVKDATGASIAGISALDKAARETGTSIDAVESILVKFNATLKEAAPSNEAGQLFKAMNLNIAELKNLDPAEALRRTAASFAQFESDGNKARAMQELFGKSVKEAAPFLNDLAEKNELVGTTSIKAAQDAETFNKQIFALKAEVSDLARAITAEALPALITFLKNFREIKAQGNLGLIVKDAAKDMIGLGNLTNDPGADINKFIRERDKLTKRLEFATAKGFATDGIKSDIDEVNRYLQVSRTRQLGRVAEEFSGDYADAMSRRMNKPLPKLPATFKPAAAAKGGGSSDDPTKKLLDNQLKELERYISAEKDLMSERNKFLDLFNSQGLISIKDYYQAQGDIRDEATKNQIKAYDEEIAALRKYQAATSKKTDKAEAQGKINELLEKQAKLQKDAGLSALESGLKQTQAMKEYANTIAETNARLLELQGEVGKAAAIRFDLQNEGLSKLFSAQGNTEMGEKLKRIRELTIAQADLNKLSGDYGLIQGQLQIAEDRIALAQKMGTQGELDGLVKLGEARRASYDQLKSIAEQYERIAKASGDPQMLLKADQLKLSLEQLSAELDPLANKFNTMFSDAASSAFGDFISGTKSAKDAFRGFIDDVFSQITKMVSQNLFQKLFGGMLGGDSGGGFNFGSLLSGLFGGGRASGGPVAPNTMYRVNEQGPELFKAANGDQFLMTGTQGGSITPNGALKGGGGQTLNVYLQGRVERETPNQIAMEVRRRSNIAASRFA